jgi:hypothetical protein
MERRKSYSDHLESVRRQLPELQIEAQFNWTPGQVLGEIISYLDRVEGFKESNLATVVVRQRMQRLTRMLSASVERSLKSGLDPMRLEGIFRALAQYDDLLSGKTATGPASKAARDLVRIEISYLSPDS